MHGRRNDEIVRDFLGPDVPPQAVFEHGAAKERLFRKMLGPQLAARMVPGLVDFLERARPAPIALATNAEPANVDFVLNGAGIRSFFSVIVDGTRRVYGSLRQPTVAIGYSLRDFRDSGLDAWLAEQRAY